MKTPDIFYVEDDPDYVFFMENAVQEVGDNLILTVAADGQEAIRSLRKFVEEHTIPKLILLDLNLPNISGLDILRFIREIPAMKTVPVLLFSTSDSPKDVRASIEFGANAYVTKPDGYDKLLQCVDSVQKFWFNHHLHVN
ncbi:response regulator [Pedobacter sp. SYP-B3415]|uniref:response regulator n=1 Tax=Pedobacter sp. SYP-B3415 TaxID=2496641 RepID=UPI00101C3D5D|nr:response regulator [Pedobacter sp. SYP-B3415]